MMAAIFRRDLRAALQEGSGIGVSLLFFVSALILTPFAFGPGGPALARAGPGLLWIFALLAILLGLDRLFKADKASGALDILLAETDFTGLALAAAAKIAAHWVSAVLPLILAAPFLALLLKADAAHALAAAASLALGTPAIAAIGAAGAALTVALPRGGMLLSALVLPLVIPVIIFGAATAEALAAGGSLEPLYLLLALSLFFIFLGPIAAAAALRFSAE